MSSDPLDRLQRRVVEVVLKNGGCFFDFDSCRKEGLYDCYKKNHCQHYSNGAFLRLFDSYYCCPADDGDDFCFSSTSMSVDERRNGAMVVERENRLSSLF